MNYLLKISQRDVNEYAALTDKFVFVCDLCDVMVSEYDNDDGLHGDVKAFVDGVEDELIRRAPTRFVVEVRATDRTWFSAVEAEGARTPEEADALVAKLRAQGFEARARILD